MSNHLSHIAYISYLHTEKDLNPQRLILEPSALPIELSVHKCHRYENRTYLLTNIKMWACVYSVHSDKKSYVLTIRRTDDNKNEDLINSVSKYFLYPAKFRSNWISTITLFWAGMLNRTTPSPWKGDVLPLHQIRIYYSCPRRIRTFIKRSNLIIATVHIS